MDPESFVHKELLRLYPAYAALDTPDAQLSFFLELPLITRRSLKAASLRHKGVGPHKLLLNDPSVDTKALCYAENANVSADCSAAFAGGAAARPSLSVLMAAHAAAFLVDLSEDAQQSTDAQYTEIDRRILSAYQSWRGFVTDSKHVCIPGPPMELVGFLTPACLDTDLCVFDVMDLYGLLVRHGEACVQRLLGVRFPLTHDVPEEAADGHNASIRNVPAFADPGMAVGVSMEDLLQQFRSLRKQSRLWLLTGLHGYVVALLEGGGPVSGIPDIFLLEDTDRAQDGDTEESENKNRTVIVKSREAAARIYLDEPFLLPLGRSSSNGRPGALRTLLDTVRRHASASFDELCAELIPLFPQGWA